MAHSQEIRVLAVRAYEENGGTLDEVASRFSIGRATLVRWVQRWRELGSVAKLPRGGGVIATIHGERLQFLRDVVEQDNDATLRELSVVLQSHFSVRVGTSQVSRALKLLRLTKKKKASLPLNG